jgi:carbon monoxide dehydrogenase subunit G
MQMTGEQRIAAPRARVWEALNDPDVLRQCIPGCQSLEREGADRFVAVAEIRIGPIGARFRGTVQLSDIDAPNGYTITGQGNGGIAGSAKGGAQVRLSDDGAGTLVSYVVEAEVGGRMAQLGGPIIDATARQLAAKFFARFGEVVTGKQAPAAASAPVKAVARARPTSAGWQGFPWSWAVALAIAVVAGFLLGQSGAAPGWIVAVLLLALAAAGAGYESGRRSGGGE